MIYRYIKLPEKNVGRQLIINMPLTVNFAISKKKERKNYTIQEKKTVCINKNVKLGYSVNS